MSDRIVKDGWCKQCSRSDIGVSWHPGSRSWYCTDCWPAIHEKREERRQANLSTEVDSEREKDRLYGPRVADDPQNIAAFLMVCPEHGVCGSNLTILEARRMVGSHMELHDAQCSIAS